jgi:hypothetical protein
MIRLTWLQFRAQAVTAAAALAAFAALLTATGLHLASLYTANGLSSCHAGSCQQLAENFIVQIAGTYTVLYLISVAVILLAPAVIGLFWGAPLIAHELETGTSPLAWNQSVTRTRWLAVKLTLIGLAAMAVTEAVCLMQTWWAAPIGRASGDGAIGGPLTQGRFTQLVFATHGINPARLRRLRLRPRRRRRGADPAHHPGHGRHPGHLRRPPGRDTAVGPPQPRPARPHSHPGHLAGSRHPV